MMRLLCIDTVVGTVNVYERASKADGGCKEIGKGQLADWTRFSFVDRESLEHFRLNCARKLEVLTQA